jgi:hypothetical protein
VTRDEFDDWDDGLAQPPRMPRWLGWLLAVLTWRVR